MCILSVQTKTLHVHTDVQTAPRAAQCSVYWWPVNRQPSVLMFFLIVCETETAESRSRCDEISCKESTQGCRHKAGVRLFTGEAFLSHLSTHVQHVRSLFSLMFCNQPSHDTCCGVMAKSSSEFNQISVILYPVITDLCKLFISIIRWLTLINRSLDLLCSRDCWTVGSGGWHSQMFSTLRYWNIYIVRHIMPYLVILLLSLLVLFLWY